MGYCAYSFLDEVSSQCDYEIATDRLASFLGLAMHYIKHIDKEDLLFYVKRFTMQMALFVERMQLMKNVLKK